jgi:sulfur carrier protein
MTGQVYVNGTPRALARDTTLGQLVADLTAGETLGVAVALNGSVVPRSQWPTRTVARGDRVEILVATQGG